MSFLLLASLRGSLLFLIVFGLDRLFCTSMRAARRRWWWLLVPAAYLAPVDVFALVRRLPPVLHLVSMGSWGSVEHFARLPFSSSLSGVFGAVVASVETPLPHMAPRFFAAPFSILGTIWAAGALTYVALLAWRTFRVSHRWSRERLSTDARFLDLLEDCKQEMNVTIPVALVITPAVPAPALLGWIRPRILLPAAVAEYPLAQLRAVLIHELAHLRSGDLPVNWTFSVVCAVHWFNPLAHLSFGAWRQFQEEAADEAAINCIGDRSGLVYGQALLHALAGSDDGTVPYGALGLGESLQHLKRRFHMINQHIHKTSRSLLATALALALVLVAGVFPVHAADETSPNERTAIVAAMLGWMHEIDAAHYTQSWADAAPYFKKKITAKKWSELSEDVRGQAGKNLERTMISLVLPHAGDGKPLVPGDTAVAKFNSSFEHMAGLRETVTFRKCDDGTWRALGYFIVPQ